MEVRIVQRGGKLIWEDFIRAKDDLGNIWKLELPMKDKENNKIAR